MENNKATIMPTDTVIVVNDGAEKSHIGEGEMIVRISGDDYGMKYSVEVRGGKINGISEKQIGFAEDIRRKTIETAMKTVSSKRDTMIGKLGAKYVEIINGEIVKHGMKTYSEFLAHALASDKRRIGDLLVLNSAREIIDKYRM